MMSLRKKLALIFFIVLVFSVIFCKKDPSHKMDIIELAALIFTALSTVIIAEDSRNQTDTQIKLTIQEMVEDRKKNEEKHKEELENITRYFQLLNYPYITIANVRKLENSDTKYEIEFENIGLSSIKNFYYTDKIDAKDSIIANQCTPWGDESILKADEKKKFIVELSSVPDKSTRNLFATFGISYSDIYDNEYRQQVFFSINNYLRFWTEKLDEKKRDYI